MNSSSEKVTLETKKRGGEGKKWSKPGNPKNAFNLEIRSGCNRRQTKTYSQLKKNEALLNPNRGGKKSSRPQTRSLEQFLQCRDHEDPTEQGEEATDVEPFDWMGSEWVEKKGGRSLATLLFEPVKGGEAGKKGVNDRSTNCGRAVATTRLTDICGARVIF